MRINNSIKMNCGKEKQDEKLRYFGSILQQEIETRISMVKEGFNKKMWLFCNNINLKIKKLVKCCLCTVIWKQNMGTEKNGERIERTDRWNLRDERKLDRTYFERKRDITYCSSGLHGGEKKRKEEAKVYG